MSNEILTSRLSQLSRLSDAIAGCRLCRDRPAKGPEHRLVHEPRPVAILSARARILIAGQAPGLRVHESGLPFNDASGDRLREWLGVSRETFYDTDNFAILPMGFCFPGYDAKGHDLPPRLECAPLWRKAALEAMPQIDTVLAIGAYAQRYHLQNRAAKSMTDTVRAWREHFFVNEGLRILPLPHPSWRNSGWLNRNPWFAAQLLPVLRAHVDSCLR
ncbi:uracil-DNA glycosylase family protein [Rhizobium sp. SSA_523]|uniref:uracil-DNA glycosylase family protein n=1 Tax=Rhizobium sp. SSA_523 TaxID=2952477 RepID=UPI0020901B32|nr:uracil-DNA glycosylase family protein [Rhizobium sp. SSA_523]MCO5730036.1 uracil-DNA glycosylase family protein [Rhizobium sp. SSA_523]WKC25105.1 uracil-DNA glycosylase family protein [Rhizobium sp. SSA_523]